MSHIRGKKGKKNQEVPDKNQALVNLTKKHKPTTGELLWNKMLNGGSIFDRDEKLKTTVEKAES